MFCSPKCPTLCCFCSPSVRLVSVLFPKVSYSVLFLLPECPTPLYSAPRVSDSALFLLPECLTLRCYAPHVSDSAVSGHSNEFLELLCLPTCCNFCPISCCDSCKCKLLSPGGPCSSSAPCREGVRWRVNKLAKPNITKPYRTPTLAT